jgi:hypothetical protein
MTFLMKFGVLPAVTVGLYLVTAVATDPRRSSGEDRCSANAIASMTLDLRETLECIKCRLEA